jgi:hypothetical protein
LTFPAFRTNLGIEVIVSKSLLVAAMLFVAPAPAIAAAASDDCAVLDVAFRQARTEFPALKNRQFGGGLCTYRTNEFKCAWGFPTDRYGDADDQIGRLQRCTAAQPHAQLLKKGRGETVYQIDPDTKVLIRGPEPYEGDWAIQLKIVTTADW